MRILVTGATGKVGSRLIENLRTSKRHASSTIRALCHNRIVEGVEVIKGSISDRNCVRQAMKDVTHVVHLATCKETADDVMDVAVKGLFWLLEEFRLSASSQQFILIGGDAAVGHFFYDHGEPITEKIPHRAYPGCYALSKVLEEVMVQQFHVQYGIDACCLRAPWIMDKDDFKYSLSFGDDVFGGPVWKDLVPPELARKYHESGTVPLLRDAKGMPLKRNFVHVDDLVEAITLAMDRHDIGGRLFNICMDRPVVYGEVAEYLKSRHGLASIDIPSGYHSNWMDNSAAKFALGWRPNYDLAKLIDAAWSYRRSPDDPRKVWYPG